MKRLQKNTIMCYKKYADFQVMNSTFNRFALKPSARPKKYDRHAVKVVGFAELDFASLRQNKMPN
jgi:hypothetical protein